MSEQEYQRGQEVEVTYRARVVEVRAGSADTALVPTLLRLETLDGSYNSPPGGWIDPGAVSVTVVIPPLPTQPGLYWCNATEQSHMGRYHTDGRAFHYLNTAGLWVDIGWGSPDRDDLPLNLMVDLPF